MRLILIIILDKYILKGKMDLKDSSSHSTSIDSKATHVFPICHTIRYAGRRHRSAVRI